MCFPSLRVNSPLTASSLCQHIDGVLSPVSPLWRDLLLFSPDSVELHKEGVMQPLVTIVQVYESDSSIFIVCYL